MASYLRADLKWAPAYDIRLERENVLSAVLRADIPRVPKGTRLAVAPARLAEEVSPSETVTIGAPGGVVARMPLALDGAKAGQSATAPLVLTFHSLGERSLPAGTVSCFDNGVFVGRARFAGAPPGEKREILCGSGDD